MRERLVTSSEELMSFDIVKKSSHQWFKNGDHPDDGDERHPTEGWRYEGRVVRYFRHPDIPGETICNDCGQTMHDHGWIDAGVDGLTVCPGDWVLTWLGVSCA